MISDSPLVTADQLFNLPSDGMRRELVRGEIFILNPADGEHGAIAHEIAWLSEQHVRRHGIGRLFAAETGFLLDRNPDTVRAPDVAFIRKERIDAGGIPATFISGAPDLAVEVLSPGDRASEVEAKVADWLQHGTAVVWVVNPRQSTVSVHRSGQGPQLLTAGDFLEDTDLLAGFKVRVGDFFANR
jgi:Uma2 family endonuclease